MDKFKWWLLDGWRETTASLRPVALFSLSRRYLPSMPSSCLLQPYLQDKKGIYLISFHRGYCPHPQKSQVWEYFSDLTKCDLVILWGNMRLSFNGLQKYAFSIAVSIAISLEDLVSWCFLVFRRTIKTEGGHVINEDWNMMTTWFCIFLI